MAIKADDYVYITKWHEDYQPDPRPQVGDIYSGLRAPAGSRAKDVTSPCQYWIKGLPAICTNFSEDKCSLEAGDDGSYPTGYNNGKCDYLGRRNWCDKYEGGTENLDEYVCIAPDMFRTGLGKRDTSVTTHLQLIPYPKSEILGYNESGGAGKCDGLGMGRGKGGEGTTDPEKIYKLPVVCRHYKPWIMGFGAIKPRPMGTAILEGKDIYDGSPSDPLSDMTRYLPFSFRILNLRAYYQKCAYWDQDYGTDFEMDYLGGYASITLPEDPLTECTCKNDASLPYRTIIDEWPEHASDTLVDVLTKEGHFICNGAHSECPCYTGKWYFCVADNMRDGMRITAEQILELRFWAAVWQNKEVYDSVFAEKTGPTEVTTSDLFTFDKWEKLGASVNDSVMKGKRIYQCFPIPYHQRVFDPEIYLTKESITYPKATAITGTSDSKKSSFPTLVRVLDEGNVIPPLDVIYPYTCKDPWIVKPCDKDALIGEPMEVASCKMEPPATAIFGYTVRNKEVYALNVNKLSLGTSVNFNQFKKTALSLLPEAERIKINESIKDLINTSMENGKDCKYIVSGGSNKYGYFGIGPLQLEHNTITTIAIICKYTSTEYEVVIRDVKSKFYGGAIIQNNFEFKYGDDEGGNYATLPSYFSPSAKLSGQVHTFGGDTHSVFPVYSLYMYGIIQDVAYFSYCVNEYTVKGDDAETTKWVRIGSTGYILAEIDNVNISYLFDFEVTKAYIKPDNNPNDSSKNLNVCGDTSGSNIDLEVVYPKVGDPDAIKRRHLLPDCVLLKSANPQGFFNENWTLSVEYKYKVLESSKPDSEDEAVSIVWPTDLDEEGSSNKFVSPPFTLTQEEGSSEFTVENIRTGTIAVMAYIQDEDERIQAATATKMLLDVVTTRCRPVEISYSYKADAVGYDLIPNSGFFTWVGGDKVLDGEYSHYMMALCGDHDCNPDNCKGPMWFPFNDCTTMDFYSFYCGAATCTSPVEGQPRSDWRYRMADEYKAWVRIGNNWATSCGNGWYYSYSKAGENEFCGFGKIRTSVLSKFYDEMGWTMPPFGNDGRELTERWLSQDHYSFWDISGADPTPRSEYMPLVFDDECLFTSFDAFEEQGRIGPVANYFHTTCMLNYMLSSIIGEVIEEERYGFEALFVVKNHAWCMYPPPVYEGPGGSVTARRYNFKIEGVAWAWREYWKDIERGIGGEDDIILNFVSFTKPPYYFDSEKKEHRLITDEGSVEISYTCPIPDGLGGYLYPTICIVGGVPRLFEIMYDDYNDEQVDWIDEVAPPEPGDLEGGGGEFGGGGASGGWSGGGGGEYDTAIYEKAMGSGWFHDINTIFDENASTEVSEERKIIFGESSVGYNRGLIANIPKNRLVYLPYEEEITEDYDIKYSKPGVGGMVWYNEAVFSDEVIFSYTPSTESSFCLTKIVISGYIGGTAGAEGEDALIFCKPEIIIAEYSRDDEGGTGNVIPAFPPTTLYNGAGIRGENKSEIVFDVEAVMDKFPTRMLYTPTNIQIKFTLFTGQHLKLDKVDLYTSMYVDATETVKVWEQKYITSTGEFGDKNPDGPESFNLRSYDRDLKNAGQYFPTGINSSNQDSIKMFDKMTMVGAGKQYYEDIDLDISIDNLKEVEKDEQEKLYVDAYNKDNYDELTYDIIIPPNVQQFFDANNISSKGVGDLCTFTSEKLPWDKHPSVQEFQQDGDFWQAGGHYFRWGDSYYKTTCWIIGPIETIYSPVFVHHKHGGEVITRTPYEAYVGWGKLFYLIGKSEQAAALGRDLTKAHHDFTWAGLGTIEFDL